MNDDDLLMLSGIQHLSFCPRQWALIHTEQCWAENDLTLEGNWLHERVDTPELEILLRGKVTLRSVSLVSHQLGLYGISDAVEFESTDDPAAGIPLPGRSGRWMAAPVEYKRGKPKSDDIDRVQLCAEAIALEEMWHTTIAQGYIYYGQTRHRECVPLDSSLRTLTRSLAKEMHRLAQIGQTPPPHYTAKCKRCSLVDLCLPQEFTETTSVNRYIERYLP